MKFLPASAPAWILGLIIFVAPPLLPAQGNVMQPPAGNTVVHFVSVTAFDLPRIVPAPPAPGSLAAQADLDTVLQAQAWRTEQEMAWARLIEKQTVFSVYGPVLGPDFTAENFPTLVQLVADVTDDLRPVSEAAKKLYPRARPYAVDSRVQPCIPAPKSDTYPSGHALTSHLMAEILERIFPAQAAALAEQAKRACWGRVLGGVHFPTDLEGSRLLAVAMMTQLERSPAFRDALARCQAEARARPVRKAA
jgi:acid phosphatase (class A)